MPDRGQISGNRGFERRAAAAQCRAALGPGPARRAAATALDPGLHRGRGHSISSKTKRIVWRGGTTGNSVGFDTHPRTLLVQRMGAPRPRDIDVGYHEEVQGKTMPRHLMKAGMSIRDQLRSAFVVAVEANVASSLKWILWSNSVPIMPPPRYESWLLGLPSADGALRAMRSVMADLDRVLKWCRSNPKKCAAIAAQGKAYIAPFFNEASEREMASRPASSACPRPTLTLRLTSPDRRCACAAAAGANTYLEAAVCFPTGLGVSSVWVSSAEPVGAAPLSLVLERIACASPGSAWPIRGSFSVSCCSISRSCCVMLNSCFCRARPRLILCILGRGRVRPVLGSAGAPRWGEGSAGEAGSVVASASARPTTSSRRSATDLAPSQASRRNRSWRVHSVVRADTKMSEFLAISMTWRKSEPETSKFNCHKFNHRSRCTSVVAHRVVAHHIASKRTMKWPRSGSEQLLVGGEAAARQRRLTELPSASEQDKLWTKKLLDLLHQLIPVAQQMPPPEPGSGRRRWRH